MMNRTYNVVESFNKRFREGFGHSNQTIWNFISAMQLEHSMTDTKHTAVLVGERPPKRLHVETIEYYLQLINMVFYRQ